MLIHWFCKHSCEIIELLCVFVLDGIYLIYTCARFAIAAATIKVVTVFLSMNWIQLHCSSWKIMTSYLNRCSTFVHVVDNIFLHIKWAQMDRWYDNTWYEVYIYINIAIKVTTQHVHTNSLRIHETLCILTTYSTQNSDIYFCHHIFSMFKNKLVDRKRLVYQYVNRCIRVFWFDIQCVLTTMFVCVLFYIFELTYEYRCR